jgi:hypothetical protein
MSNRILNTRVSGVTFEGRQNALAVIRTSDPCRIVPEPENKYDVNALAVHVAHDGKVLHVGYIPRELAAEIAPYLEGESVMVEILEITGGFETRDGDTAPLGMRIRVELPQDLPF